MAKKNPTFQQFKAAMETVELVIHTDIKRFCKNESGGIHDARGKYKAAKEWGYVTWLEAGSPTFKRKVRLDVIIVRSSGRMIDEPNIWWGMGGFIDGALSGNMLVSDGPKWLKCGEITQHSGKQYLGQECIRMVLTPIT